MIPLTLLCLALFALAWGYRTAWQRAKRKSDYWMWRAIVAEEVLDMSLLDVPRLDFPRPLSCLSREPHRSLYSIEREGASWPLSPAERASLLGCGEARE